MVTPALIGCVHVCVGVVLEKWQARALEAEAELEAIHYNASMNGISL